MRRANSPRRSAITQDAITACPTSAQAELNVARTYEALGDPGDGLLQARDPVGAVRPRRRSRRFGAGATGAGAADRGARRCDFNWLAQPNPGEGWRLLEGRIQRRRLQGHNRNRRRHRNRRRDRARVRAARSAVLVTGRNASHLEPVRGAIRKAGGKCEMFVVDVRDAEPRATRWWPRPIEALRPARRADQQPRRRASRRRASTSRPPDGARWSRSISTALFSARRRRRAGIVARRAGGRVINTVLDRRRAWFGSTMLPYAASKAGVIKLTEVRRPAVGAATEHPRELYRARARSRARAPPSVSGPTRKVKAAMLRSRAAGVASAPCEVTSLPVHLPGLRRGGHMRCALLSPTAVGNLRGGRRSSRWAYSPSDGRRGRVAGDGRAAMPTARRAMADSGIRRRTAPERCGSWLG